MAKLKDKGKKISNGHSYIPTKLEWGTKALQFDVCCKAIEPSF